LPALLVGAGELLGLPAGDVRLADGDGDGDREPDRDGAGEADADGDRPPGDPPEPACPPGAP
jgi:hypothetical protein